LRESSVNDTRPETLFTAKISMKDIKARHRPKLEPPHFSLIVRLIGDAVTFSRMSSGACESALLGLQGFSF
jgi:hypothetical protein